MKVKLWCVFRWRNIFYLFLLGLAVLPLACGQKVEPTGAVTMAAAPTPTLTPVPTVCSNLGFVSLVGGGGAKANNFIEALTFAVSSPVTITSLSMHVDTTGGGNTVLGLYSDNSGVPGTLLASGVISDTVSSWNTVSVTPVAISAGNYWLAFDNSSSSTIFDQGTGSVTNYQLTYAYSGSLPATWPAGGLSGPLTPYALYVTGCN
jgi:hypothetical protein